VKEERDTFGMSVATLRLLGVVARLLFTLLLLFSDLESQISTVSYSQSISPAELDSFRERGDDIEREKRDLLGIVSRLKEVSAQHDGVFFFLLHVHMPNEYL
jgi:hypothetical protein